VVPKIQERLRQGFKIKDSGDFYKKDHEDLMEILEADMPPKVRVFFSNTEFNISINVDTHYHVSEFSVHYPHEYVYLFNITENKVMEYETLPDVTEQEIKKAKKELAKLTDEQRKINAKISEVKLFLD